MFVLFCYCLRSLGPAKCQNFDADFRQMKTNEGRYFSKTYIKRKLANGTTVDRDWVIFSPALECVLCFVCKLFGTPDQNIETFRTNGFKDWKNCNRSFTVHENSKHHITNYLTYRTRAKQTSTLDVHFLQQEQSEMNYWREVLRRVVSVVKFLAARGLAFRGDDEKFGSHKNGNYLGILELLSQYDPFLANHISNYGNKGSGRGTYSILQSELRNESNKINLILIIIF